MRVKAVAQFTGQPANVGVHPGDVDGDVRVVDPARGKRGRHECVSIEFALKIEFRAVLPAVPNRAQGEHDLAQLGTRRLPLHAVAALIVALDLGADPQDEAARGGALQVPGRIGQRHRAARKCQGNRGAELQAVGRCRRYRQRQERVVLVLHAPYAVEAEVLGVAGNRNGVVKRMGGQQAVEFHRHPSMRSLLGLSGSMNLCGV